MGLCGDFYAISGALLTRQKIGCQLGELQAESFGGQLVLFFLDTKTGRLRGMMD